MDFSFLHDFVTRARKNPHFCTGNEIYYFLSYAVCVNNVNVPSLFNIKLFIIIKNIFFLNTFVTKPLMSQRSLEKQTVEDGQKAPSRATKCSRPEFCNPHRDPKLVYRKLY